MTIILDTLITLFEFFEFLPGGIVFSSLLTPSHSLFCLLGRKPLVRVKRKKVGQHHNVLKQYHENGQGQQEMFCSNLQSPKDQNLLLKPFLMPLLLLSAWLVIGNLM